MTFPAIEVSGLGKRYRVGERVRRANTIRDAAAVGVQSAIARIRQGISPGSAADEGANHFWALRNLDFTVERGEAVGIVGPNGAGKSTLLKVLSRITEPTEGEVRIRGRVGSLLEVGTGFHSELTGRENTYLSGAILGMRSGEIDRKFDEIVAFAEIDRFIDTPIKHYSSGMFLRLAFAVAAHLEPDILIVDEVLAVGDIEFQRKCLGKMEEISRGGGRTVCFVSHNMAAVQRLCTRAILLRKGEIVATGTPSEIARKYAESGSTEAIAGSWIPIREVLRRGSGTCRFEAARFSSESEDTALAPYSDGPLEISLRIHADNETEIGSLAATFYDPQGAKLVNADTVALGGTYHLRPGSNIFVLRIDALHLKPGSYALGLWLADRAGVILDFVESVFHVEVVDPPGPLARRPVSDGSVTCSFQVRQET
ncbi:ABC transporter ATP-binding protein [soil metagenome]